MRQYFDVVVRARDVVMAIRRDGAFLGTVRRQSLLAVGEPDGRLRFDIRFQGDRETVFLTFPRHQE